MKRLTLVSLAVLLLTASLLSGSQAWAQQVGQQPAPKQYGEREQSAIDDKRAAVQARAEDGIQQLFQRLCPGRCELVGVEVAMTDPKPRGNVSPGFEALGPRPFDLEAKTVTASVLLDQKLPQNFKSSLPRMIEYQLADLAPKIEVRQEVLDFPTPQNRPMPPEQQTRNPQPRQRPLPAPMPRPDEQNNQAPEPEPVAQPDTAEDDSQALSALLGAALPWVGLMLVILLIFGLGLVFMKRLAELFFDQAKRGGDDAALEDTKKARPVDVDGLRAELNRSRSLRNRVLRRWLQEDPSRVAQLVGLVGPEILSDIKKDTEHRDQLGAVGEEVARLTEPLDDDEAQALAREVKARLNAARVVHTDEDLAMEWSFLEGLGAPKLRRVLQGLTPNEKLYVVGKLPAPLRSSYLEGLDADERRTFFQTGSLESLDKAQALELAARLRKAVEDVSHVGGEVEVRATLMRDMLGSLRLDEQMESVQQMVEYRPEVAESLLSMVCLEAATAALPADVIAEAVHQLPVETLTSFLNETDPRVHSAVLEALPADKRGAVQTELSLDLRVGRREFFSARKAVTDLVQEVMQRGGYDLAAANKRALASYADGTHRGGPHPDRPRQGDPTTTTTPQEASS